MDQATPVPVLEGASGDGVRLTRREREVLEFVAQGLSNRQIAGQLHLTTNTIQKHVHNILEKLAPQSLLQVTAVAHRAVPQPDPRRSARHHHFLPSAHASRQWKNAVRA